MHAHASALLLCCLPRAPLPGDPPARAVCSVGLQAACPNCGEVNTTYFGDILTVAGACVALQRKGVSAVG